MTPSRRWSDSTASLERLLDQWRLEMRDQFAQLNTRLDGITSRVNEHGEAIAMIRQGCIATLEVSADVRALSEAFAAHQARCPYDHEGSMLVAQGRWTNQQLAGGIAGGRAGMLALLQLAQWLVERLS